MKKIAVFALLALLILPYTAHAQDADARAQILKGQIEGFLENQKSMALKNGCKLDTKGNVTVEKASGYYAFTLPHITYTDSKGVRSEIGMVALNAIPEDGHDWKISMALPTPINSYGSGGGAMFKTDIGTQNASGIWNERLGHFTSVNGSYGNIRLSNLIDQSTATVETMTLNTALNEQDADVFTGTARAVLENILIRDGDTGFQGTIPKIALSTNLADRAGPAPMSKEQVKNRPQSGHPDFYNVFAFLFGAPERIQAEVHGLDTINTQLQQSMMTAPPEKKQDLFVAMAGVSVFNSMGKPLPADPSVKTYDITLGQNGSVSINGTSLDALENPAANKISPAAGTPILR